jgi:hypothetical protein
MNGEAGCVIVPAGNPTKLMEAAFAKPFKPAMEIESWAALPPGFTVSRAGKIDRLKSAAGVTVKPRGAEWESAPLVPFTDS